ncbi:MAG: CotH kinase family protein [Cyclobacteriaceae bacterium]|nr:CotH kinase family protein [Cyclobacteriaceae bacterium]
MKKSCCLIVLLFLGQWFFPVYGQLIRINEIMASNAGTLTDEDGDYADWIELYNSDVVPVQLRDFGLSDNINLPYKWTFPDCIMQPGEYLLVWASGKDRRPEPGALRKGIVREVFFNIPGTSVNHLVNHPDYPEKPDQRQMVSHLFEAPSNIADNYGQRMFGLLKAPLTGNYIFWIASDDNGELWISENDSDENLLKIAEVPGWTQQREWNKYPVQQSEPIFLEEGKYYYIKAIMKEGQGGDNLAIAWQLPDGSLEAPMSAEHIFWKATELHTNFSISSAGEELLLTDVSGNVIDEMAPVSIPTDLSFGRWPDGTTTLRYFKEPTPGTSNQNSTAYEVLLQPPVFSHTGGFYGSGFQLSLNTQHEDAIILYTLDGSTPDPENPGSKTYQYKNSYRQNQNQTSGPLLERSVRTLVYEMPLNIQDRSPMANQVANISSTFHHNPFYFPSQAINKATVVKARVIKEGALSSDVVSHTFFVNPQTANPYTLPVISVSASEAELFEFEKGIYTAGKFFEDWRNSNPSAQANGGSPANYHQRGMDWEIRGHIELYEPAGHQSFTQEIGFRIHGGWSREHPMKSLRLLARNEYGKNTIDHPFFAHRPYSSFRRLLLRNSGNDFYYTMLRDAAIQEMMQHLDFDTQASEPAIVFLNGEYWGIHNIRERIDKYFIAQNYGVDDELIDLLDNNGGIVEGDNTHYRQMLQYIEENGLTETQHYAYLKTQMDVENYIDYLIAQVFIANTDWPGNNVQFWRYRTDYKPNAPKGQDGRWRWMLFDTDFGFGLYDPDNVSFNMLEFLQQNVSNDWPNPAWSTFLFRKLTENQEFNNAFVSRFNDQLNSALKPEPLLEVIQRMEKKLEPEILRHIQRWNVIGSVNNWKNQVMVMKSFAENRQAPVKEHLRSHFNLGQDYLLRVEISHPRHGMVKVNSLELQGRTTGISEMPYPWSGTYFKGLPLVLEALPNPGYEFLRWEGEDFVSEADRIELLPESDLKLKAVFRKAGPGMELIHYWNFNQSDEPLKAFYTLYEATLEVELPEAGNAEVTLGTGQGFVAENAQFENLAGSHLRINNPLGVTLKLEVPTVNFSSVLMQFETRRSGQGAGLQIIEYSTDGIHFIEKAQITVNNDNPVVISLDFSDDVVVNDNPLFSLRITFAQGEGGTAGNNRLDNITFKGIPDDKVNLPPVLIAAPGDKQTIEDGDELILFPALVFEDPEKEMMIFTVYQSNSAIADVEIQGERLSVKGRKRGETQISLRADDGVNAPVETSFRLLVYPKPHLLAKENFYFDYWDPDAPEMSFPEYMIFLQSDLNDPDIDDSLRHAYSIPESEYAAADLENVGFPYRNTSRTRINGLEDEGIAFINTGRGRDLGGALLALNTEGLQEIQAEWLAATLLKNSRIYGLSLQYRLGYTGIFQTLSNTTYINGEDGHEQSMGPFTLPAVLVNQPYIQLLWRYHHTGIQSGPRARIRLDDIMLAANPGVPEIQIQQIHSDANEAIEVSWSEADRAQSYEIQLAGDIDFQQLFINEKTGAETHYKFSQIQAGKLYYIRVRAVNESINGEWSHVASFQSVITSLRQRDNAGSILQVVPNPFQHNAAIHLTMETEEISELSIFDLSGKKLKTIFSGILKAGKHTFELNGDKLIPGSYIIVCQTGQGVYREKVVR